MNDPISKYWVLRLLRVFCPEHLYEEIEGDLIQRFNRDLNPSDRLPTGQAGLERLDGYWKRRAKKRLIWNTIRFFRPGIMMRNRFSIRQIPLYMIGSYLKMATRSLMKHKVHSFITIFGLALGLAVCLVIWNYVEFEKSYDDFNTKSNRIYRTHFAEYKNGERVYSSPYFGYGLGPSLLEDMPEVETFVRMRSEKALVNYSVDSNHSIEFEEQIDYVDSTFFQVFTYEALQGNLPTALSNPSSVVLTQSAAKKYFGDGVNSLGKTLRVVSLNGIDRDFEITAIIRDVPQNSHMDFDFLIPINNLLQTANYREPNAQWDWVNFITYVLVYPNANLATMNAKTDALLTKYTGPNPPGTFFFTFQPLRDIHLAERNENIFSNVYFYLLLSLFILTIAWINYVNLSTARAMERAKEVAVKKTMGVARTQLVSQFLFESLCFTFLSVMLAIVMAVYLLPLLADIVGKKLSFDFTQLSFWITTSALTIMGSLVSGIYPAFILSSFKIAHVIKGKTTRSGNGLSFRNALTVFQFTASLILIVGTFTVYRQIQFMQNHEKGMNTQQMLIVNGPKIISESDQEQRLLSFKDQLAHSSFIQNIASSGSTPGRGYSLVTGMWRLGAEDKTNQRETIYVVNADYDFTDAYDIEVVAGREWNKDIYSDRNTALINEAALAPFELGDANNALNEKLVVDGEDTVAIVGVFKNVHWNSLHTATIPLLLRPQMISGGQFSIRLNGNIPNGIAEVEKLYKQNFPGNPFNYYFLDDFFNQQYKADSQFGKVIGLFAILAIVIACLGLWGLASFSTLQRMKEISVRKVLGASVNHILALLSQQYLKALLMAVLISAPLIWYSINEWLDNYAFRISLTWDLFLLPLTGLILIAFGTVSLQTVRAALTNPVNNLKNE